MGIWCFSKSDHFSSFLPTRMLNSRWCWGGGKAHFLKQECREELSLNWVTSHNISDLVFLCGVGYFPSWVWRRCWKVAYTLQFRGKREAGEESLPFPEPHKFARVSHIHFKCWWIEFKVFNGILIIYPSSLSLRSFFWNKPDFSIALRYTHKNTQVFLS